MRPVTIDDEQLIAKLTEVFRTRGYEGASLRLLAEETGLEKASLYHRFPKGKEEMANVVLQHAGKWFQTHIFNPLKQKGDCRQKIISMCNKLSEFYFEGQRSCLLDTLSISGENSPFHHFIEESFRVWIDAIKSVCMDAGIKSKEAELRATDAVCSIQGALVLARATGNTSQFQRVLKMLPTEILED